MRARVSGSVGARASSARAARIASDSKTCDDDAEAADDEDDDDVEDEDADESSSEAPHCSRACFAAAPKRVEKLARNSASLSVDEDDDDDEELSDARD
jgi:hypothetical protein